jgi:hypothetical protein
MARLHIAAFVFVLFVPRFAAATPIDAYGGTLDATLRFFDVQSTEDFRVQILLLRREYVLGVDFIPGVPLSFQQQQIPYTACAEELGGINGKACTSLLDVLIDPNGTGGSILGDNPANLATLNLGCDAGFFEVVPRTVMLARGTCSFLTKWENAVAGGYSGVLLENNNPGPPIPIGLGPSTNEPTIPFFMITQDVANEIRTGSRRYFFDGSLAPFPFDRFDPIIQMQVTWTPRATPLDPAPEPPSIVLMALGGTFIAVRRCRKLLGRAS